MSEEADKDDEVEVLAAQQGDRDAFGRLIERYDRRLLYFVRRLLGDLDSGYDVLQEVWLIVHRRLHQLRSPAAFRSWVYRISHDQAVSELRRRGRLAGSAQTETVADVVDAAADETSITEDAEMVHRGLDELSFDHRRVLTLRFLEEMSIEQIAEVIQVQPGTVKSRLHYAKAELRRWIEEHLNE